MTRAAATALAASRRYAANPDDDNPMVPGSPYEVAYLALAPLYGPDMARWSREAHERHTHLMREAAGIPHDAPANTYWKGMQRRAA